MKATAMVRYYAKPMLLIEFDDKKPFSLQAQYIYMYLYFINK